MDKTIIVIPCYNEAGRLREDEYQLLLQKPGLELLFVNDGSKDHTQEQIEEFIQKAGTGAHLLNLSVNSGKAEAVRQGMLLAIDKGAAIVGFIDADMATPAQEVQNLLEEARRKTYTIVLGSRVKLLGTDITRHMIRHYFGRVFATFASIILRLPVYDTQCGAKFFQTIPLMKDVLAQPFVTRWFFDVELIGRLMIGSPACQPLTIDDFVEVPLKKWTDVRGSKITPIDVLQVPWELLKIACHLSQRRRSLKR